MPKLWFLELKQILTEIKEPEVIVKYKDIGEIDFEKMRRNIESERQIKLSQVLEMIENKSDYYKNYINKTKGE